LRYSVRNWQTDIRVGRKRVSQLIRSSFERLMPSDLYRANLTSRAQLLGDGSNVLYPGAITGKQEKASQSLCLAREVQDC
jgi:hypothetical protein